MLKFDKRYIKRKRNNKLVGLLIWGLLTITLKKVHIENNHKF